MVLFINSQRAQRGVGLLLMLFAMTTAVLLLIAGGMMQVPVHHELISSGINGQKAFYAANAGMQRALYRANNDALPAGASQEVFDFDTGDGIYSVTIDYAQRAIPTDYDVTSTIAIGKKSVTITAIISKSAGKPALFLEWGY